ncbi:MAG: tRNA (adenine-N1)-methyltransferase [Thermoproteales archaeon]|nr:tRNA (adenine-N1)-methyltransferase [Thermoproteales archaeon]
MNETIKEKDWVLLYFNKKRHYIYRVTETKVNLNEGIVHLDKLLGKRYGDIEKTHLGVPFRILKPTIMDIILEKFTRKTQVIYPKDLGYIILKAGIGPGSNVLEAGTGSGVLTAIIANFVRPNGKVLTFEIRKDLYELAIKNIKKLGLETYVRFHQADIREAEIDTDIDAIILDLPDPWNVICKISHFLKIGGRIICFLPTINQIEKTYLALKEKGFIMIEASELLERKYELKKNAIRPKTLMRGHTGYIISAVKLLHI